MAVVDDNKYKPNSHKSKAEEAEREKLSPVVSRSGSLHKKTTGEKFKETFLGENVNSIGSYIIYEVLIPSVIDMIREGMHSATDMLLPGGSSRRARSRGRERTTPYHQMGRNKRSGDVYDVSRPTRRKEFDFSSIELWTLADADEVRQGVLDNIDVYGQVRVADFYSLADVSSSSTDNNWGWTVQDIPSIQNAEIYSFRVDGTTKYWIDMPKPRPLI